MQSHQLAMEVDSTLGVMEGGEGHRPVPRRELDGGASGMRWRRRDGGAATSMSGGKSGTGSRRACSIAMRPCLP
jgi:hypothetical protein